MATNEVIFYILLGFFFAVFFVSTNYFYLGAGSSTRSSTMKGIILSIASVVFALFFVGYASLTNLFKKESYQGKFTGQSDQMTYCPSPGAKLCRGGSYMHQGSSPRAKFCRNLASTPEGKAEIQRYECGSGFTGMRGGGFKFTPLSDGCWKNARCRTPSSCDIANNGIF